MVLKTKSCNLLTVPSKSSPREAMVINFRLCYLVIQSICKAWTPFGSQCC